MNNRQIPVPTVPVSSADDSVRIPADDVFATSAIPSAGSSGGPLAGVTRSPVIALAMALLSSALFVVPAPAGAQDRATLETLDSRLQRVERVLDASLLDQLQRIDALQQELRELRGELENVNYDLDNQTRRSTDLYGDTDQRLTDLEEARDAGVLFGGEGGLFEGGLSEGGLSEDGLSPLDEIGGPTAVIVPEGGRIPAAASFGDGPQPPTGKLRDTATQAEKASYTGAYDLLARGENEAAVDAFDAFLRSFPDGPYSDNAWYWQGEAMYAQRRFDEARRNFGAVVNSFPDSTKVPDARLKIGFALFEQGAFAEARRILTEVQDDYPGRSAAVLARKRLQQMDREEL